MKNYRLSEAASSDLDEIWFFIALDDSHTADRFIKKLILCFPMLASMPEMGRERPELSSKLRSFAFAPYVIFYRFFDDGIEIVRVLHGARDLPPLFE